MALQAWEFSIKFSPLFKLINVALIFYIFNNYYRNYIKFNPFAASAAFNKYYRVAVSRRY